MWNIIGATPPGNASKTAQQTRKAALNLMSTCDVVDGSQPTASIVPRSSRRATRPNT
jgi:hypothetical protein